MRVRARARVGGNKNKPPLIHVFPPSRLRENGVVLSQDQPDPPPPPSSFPSKNGESFFDFTKLLRSCHEGIKSRGESRIVIRSLRRSSSLSSVFQEMHARDRFEIGFYEYDRENYREVENSTRYFTCFFPRYKIRSVKRMGMKGIREDGYEKSIRIDNEERTSV